MSTLEANLSYANRLDNSSNGYNISIFYFKSIKEHSRIGVGLSHFYTSSKAPSGNDQYRVGIRKSGNISPYSDNNSFLWEEGSFPGIKFEPQVSTYFSTDINLIYSFIQEGKKNKLDLRGGIILSFKDQSQFEKYIEIDYVDFILFESTNVQVPVFTHANFLDLGISIGAVYSFIKIGNLNIGAITNIVYYPLNNSIIHTTGANLSIDVKSNKKR